MDCDLPDMVQIVLWLWVSAVYFLAFLSRFYKPIGVESRWSPLEKTPKAGSIPFIAVLGFSKGSHDAILISVIALGIRVNRYRRHGNSHTRLPVDPIVP